MFHLDHFNKNYPQHSLYGTIPFLTGVPDLSKKEERAYSGVFWMNPSDTWVDLISSQEKGVKETPLTRTAHFISEDGIIDLYLFAGDSVGSVSS